MCITDPVVSGLTLYQHHHSFYSQKVCLALLEKNVPFAEVLLNASESRQYVPWFLELNPRGEVPVLRDGEKIIVDSRTIIDYIEDNFSHGTYKKLTPSNLEVMAQVEELRNKVDAIDGNYYTCAVAFNPDSAGPKYYPFSMSFVNQGLKGVGKLSSIVLKAAEDYPAYGDALHAKAEGLNLYAKTTSDKIHLEQKLDTLILLFEFIEKQLMYRSPGKEHWWLCCEEFTVADVSLTILLYRIWLIGLQPRTFGLLPHLQEYFYRATERPAFKSLASSLMKKDVYLFANEHTTILVLILFIIIVAIVTGILVSRYLL